MLSILTVEDRATWNDLARRVVPDEAAYTADYVAAFERQGDGLARCAHFETSDGEIIYPFLMRPLDSLPFVTDALAGVFDIATPYCYGGPYGRFARGAEPVAMARFRDAFTGYARDQRIVSEFIRFHPMLQNQDLMQGLCDDIQHHTDNRVIDIQMDDDALLAQCRQSYRSGIRAAIRKGYRFERTDAAQSVDAFAAMYSDTMIRLHHSGQLNFGPEFFRRFVSATEGHSEIFFVRDPDGDIAAAALFMKNGGYIDYFLAGNRRERDNSYATHLLIHEACRWARDNTSCRTMHLGGGVPSLIYFKSGFSRQTVAYHVGGHIFDQVLYDRLVAACAAWAPLRPTPTGFFFPTYRRIGRKEG